MDSSNPYRSPQAPLEPRAAADLKPANKKLSTVLFSFEGRIPRRVYWGALLGVCVAVFVFVQSLRLVFEEESTIVKVVVFPIIILFMWSNLAVRVKRWHDRDKSGWWIFIGIIPVIGDIWSFVETGCLRGTEGPNEYGPDPT